MADKEDKEYLAECLKHTDLLTAWYISDDTVMTVARILDEEGNFRTSSQCRDFFEKPSKWEKSMRNIVEG